MIDESSLESVLSSAWMNTLRVGVIQLWAGLSIYFTQAKYEENTIFQYIFSKPELFNGCFSKLRYTLPSPASFLGPNPNFYPCKIYLL